MARKPARPARRIFAAALSRYFAGAKNPALPPGKLWSYAAFAKKHFSFAERSVSNWCNGKHLPETTNIDPILDTLFGQGNTSDERAFLKKLYWAARDEADDILKNPKLDKVGRVWRARDRVLAKDRAATSTNSRVAANPAQQRLQSQIRDLAAEIAAETKRPLYNSDLLKDLSIATSAIRALLDCPAAEIPEKLPSLYGLSLELGRILETNSAFLKDHSDEPLNEEIRGKCAKLVQIEVAWLYGFPSVVTLDSRASKAPGRETAPLAPSAPFVQCLLDRGVIDARDAAELLELLRTAGAAARRGESSGGAGQKLIALARGDATNLLLAAARDVIIARRDSAPRSADDEERTRLLALAFRDAEQAVTAMSANMGADWRQAFIGLLDECRNPPRPVDSSSVTVNAPPGLLISRGAAVDVLTWANQSGTDAFGRWASFSLPTQDGGTVSQKLRWIPPGRFWMGSPDDEDERLGAEGPRHEVTIADGFWLFDTPCTQALWQAVMGNNPSNYPDPLGPVEQVRFNDVEEFIAKVNARVAGLSLSLPSEARWEYACRAGTETARYHSDLDAIAWYVGNSGDGFYLSEMKQSADFSRKQLERNENRTRRVATRAANPWGLFDMLGNVWEWCEDTWHDSYDGAPLDGSAWLDTDARARGSADRVVRGGSWDYEARFVRAAYRDRSDPDHRFFNMGFRCARVRSGSRSERGRAEGRKEQRRERSDQRATTSPQR